MKRVTSIAYRLKEYRTMHDLTLADMEKRTGIPAQTLNRYELEQRAPKIDVAVQVAERLNINPLWLQGYDVHEGVKEPTPIHGGGLNDAEEALVNLFRLVPEENQSMVLQMIEAALKSQGLL